MDTYPTKSAKGGSIFNGKNLLIAGLIIALIYLLTCNKKVVEKPVVIKGETVEKLIDLTAQQKQAIDDSFNLIINKAYQDNDKNYTAYIKLLNENSELLMENKLLSVEYPDTCKPIVALWRKREADLKNISDRKDAAAKVTITGLQGTVWEQQRFLNAKDTMFNRLKIIADTCAVALTKMEKYVDKIKPKRSIELGVVAISPYTLFKPAAGITLGYRGKTGTQVTVGYYTNNQVSIGISKTLFRF